jgi:hypothetical protein
MPQRFSTTIRTELGWDGMRGRVVLDINVPDLFALDEEDRALVGGLIAHASAYAAGELATPAPEAELEEEQVDASGDYAGDWEPDPIVSEDPDLEVATDELVITEEDIVVEELVVDEAELDEDDEPIELPAEVAEALDAGDVDEDEVATALAVVDNVLAMGREVMRATITPEDIRAAAGRLTPIERLSPAQPLARELGIAANRVGPYLKSARSRGFLPQTAESLAAGS